MNKYEKIFRNTGNKISSEDLLSALNTASNWEDRYWLCKIAIQEGSDVSDEIIIDNLYDCLFSGLSVANKDIFYDVNEILAKSYIRYGKYGEAQSRLLVLEGNYDCPDWVHLYLATTQMHTTFKRIVEEPKYFFDRLLSVKSESVETQKEIQNILGKFLYSIVEQKPDCNVATEEIVRFAEKISYTQSDEFKIFHKTICPEIKVFSAPDNSKNPKKTSDLEAAEIKNAELEARLEKAKKAEAEYQRIVSEQKVETEKLKMENSAYAARFSELEHAQKTELAPQSIDDILFQITQWLNCSLRRYLVHWLTTHFEKTCSKNYWKVKVKPALNPKELQKFDSYKELSDFAFDALLNIYSYNLEDFYPYSSYAKQHDIDCLREMRQIRNRWVRHFEENSWTKEKILFDIDTIIDFIAQIEMPMEQQREYREFRTAVEKMS